MDSNRPASKPQHRSILTLGGGGVGVAGGGDSGVFRSPSLDNALVHFGIDLKSARQQKADKEKNPVQKSARVNTSDMSKRISEIGSNMKEFDRKMRDAEETMQEALRNSTQDRRKRKGKGSTGAADSSGASVDNLDDYQTDMLMQKCVENLKKDMVDFGLGGGDGNNNLADSSIDGLSTKESSPRKYFGLDHASVLRSSSSEASSSEEEGSSEDDSSEEEQPTTMKISIRQTPLLKGKEAKAQALKRLEEKARANKGKVPPPPPPAARGRGKKTLTKEDMLPPRSLSPIMPGVPDKQFQTILERRDERVHRHINTMQNELAQLSHKVEMDKRKARESAAETRGIMPRSYQGKPLRMMKAEPERNLRNELNSYVQSTGGPAGGWERKDHATFMKLFGVWRKKPQKLVEILKKELPHKSNQEIGGHIKWYERYEQLSNASRQTVHQWNQEKRRENELMYQMGSASQRAKLEADKRKQEHLRMIREQEKEKSKEKLAQWKRSKAVRDVTSAGSSLRAATASNSNTGFRHGPPSNESAAAEAHHQQYRSKASNAEDLAEMRHQILEVTASVHNLDNPKREFLPPRVPSGAPGGDLRRVRRPERDPFPGEEATSKLGISTSFTNLLASRPPTPPSLQPPHPQRIKLPEIEPDPPRASRPASGGIRPRSGSLLHQQQQRNRRIIAEFQERDYRNVEAKKKAVEIARERRKKSINQLSEEEVKRRIRSRVTSGSGGFLNTTKAAELRKVETSLERLEMLSQKDVGPDALREEGGVTRGGPEIKNVMALPSKGIPSWRRSGVY